MSDKKAIAVAAIGLTAVEKRSLESLCALSARREVLFAVAPDASYAQLWVVDGTHHRAMGWASALPSSIRQRIVWLGKNPLNEAADAIAKPVNWARLLAYLEQLAKRMGMAGAAPAAAPVANASAPVQRAAAPVEVSVSDAQVPVDVTSIPSDVLPPHEEADIAVLVVDDDSLARSHVANRLAIYNIKPDLSNSARHALECSRKRAYDLFFLDVNMPGTDGYTLCKALKTNSLARPDCYVAMLTSRDGLVDKLRGTLAGCDVYLTKPSEQKSVETVVGIARANREARIKKKRARIKAGAKA
jgi:two-component system, cell cycle response regulator